MRTLLKDFCLITSLYFIRLADRTTWATRMKEWGRNIEETENYKNYKITRN